VVPRAGFEPATARFPILKGLQPGALPG